MTTLLNIHHGKNADISVRIAEKPLSKNARKKLELLAEECKICGNLDLVIEDNYLRCGLCSTSICLKAEKTKKKVKEKKQQAEECSATNSDESLEWTTYEAFNIILKAQVDCLIKLGASHRLKDAVLQLWTQYLKLISVAFPDTEGDVLSSSIPKCRDFCIAKKVKLTNRRASLFPTKAKRHSNVCSEPIKILQSKTHRKRKRKNSSEDDDSPLLLEQIKDVKQKLDEECIYDSDGKTTQMCINKLKELRRVVKMEPCRVSRHASKQADYMNMTKTVAFCYLGILFIEDSILLCDIIRWIREGHFPYLDAMNLLPTHMKQFSLDYATFQRINSPPCSTVREAAGRLAHFLGIRELPEPSLNVIAARFIMDLNLPDELNSVVKNLMDIKPMAMPWGHKLNKDEESPYCSIPDYEGRMMGFIVVALKVLFGLDGFTERKIAHYTQKKLSLDEKDGRNLFVWNDWVSHINLKMDILKAYYAPNVVSGCSDVLDVNCLHQFYRQTMLKWQQRSSTNNHKGTRKAASYPVHAFFFLFNNLKESPTTSGWQPTSFPWTQIAQLFCSHCDDSTSLLLQDFRNSDLQFITQPHLWNYVKKKNSCKNGDMSMSSEDEASPLNYKYWFYDMLVNDMKNSSLEVLPESFQWVLNILCRSVELKPTELYARVLFIEKMVLEFGNVTKLSRLRFEALLW